MTTKAGSGHPTTCLSCAEIMSVLFFNEMKYDIKNPFNEDSDEFILSKGHAAPILYSSLYHTGCVKENLMTLREFGSLYEGHPMPSALKWIKVATGSLGQGLSVGVGMALAAKLQKRGFRVYVLLGDSEAAEGSVYEAFELAAHYNLNNLCAVIDINRLGQSGETMLGHNISKYKKRFEGFGCNVIDIDGHGISQLLGAFEKAKRESKRPTVILAKTYKGKGVSFLEDKEGWHGKVLNEEQLKQALEEVPNPKIPKIKIDKPQKVEINFKHEKYIIETAYKAKEMVATREAYGKALVKLANNSDWVVATDGEVKNSTHAEEIMKARPDRYIEAYIAEQNMIGMAFGLSKKGFTVFASSFACFLSRAHDQIRMAALSNANMTLVGSHAGISIGEDGPSQMGLEDIAMFRCLPGSIVLYPSDAVSTEKLVQLAANTEGLKYIRTTRPKTPVIYSNHDLFPLGDFKVLRSSHDDKVVIVGAGITVHEALKAYDILEKQGINVCVVDCYCVKPFNRARFLNLAMRSGNRVIVVEDHYTEGGIGEMIMHEMANTHVSVKSLAVNKMPHSGEPEVLMDKYGINYKAIVKAVKGFI